MHLGRLSLMNKSWKTQHLSITQAFREAVLKLLKCSVQPNKGGEGLVEHRYIALYMVSICVHLEFQAQL